MSHLTPIKAIRAKCLDCCGGQRQEVKFCGAKDCPIWPYRHGHRPRANDPCEQESGEEMDG